MARLLFPQPSSAETNHREQRNRMKTIDRINQMIELEVKTWQNLFDHRQQPTYPDLYPIDFLYFPSLNSGFGYEHINLKKWLILN